jgi:putative OmpL-like beta-barrel porin-2
MRETKTVGLLVATIVCSGLAYGQTQTAVEGAQVNRDTLQAEDGSSLLESALAQDAPAKEPAADPPKPQWHYGGFVDLGYLLDFNHPSNDLFRSRDTTFRVDDLQLNMALAYLKKQTSTGSRWGTELTVQAGKDSEVFGFSPTAPNISGSDGLRHLGPTNVSYLAPVGKGLTLQGGIFSSLIGYDSLYAKDNFTYTRPWGADFTPYLMMGVNASYPFTEKLTGALFVVNGYAHLADANSVPSSGAQLTYNASPRVNIKETVFSGPHQADTSLSYCRFLSDSIVEHKADRITLDFEYIYASERVVAPGNPRALMMAGQLPVHWALNNRWSVTVRPEVFWDRDGRWTLFKQTVKAVTTTLEYRIPYRLTNTLLRIEHRYDDSRGPGGGFFRGAEVQPGVVGLTPTQHLLIFALIFTFDH